jgi:hypothetical protein
VRLAIDDKLHFWQKFFQGIHMKQTIKSNLQRSAMLVVTAASLSACIGVGIAVPLGPFGSIGLGLNGNGQLTGNLGVGGHIGSVGIGGGTSIPLGTLVAPQATTNAPVQQSGASQNMPR